MIGKDLGTNDRGSARALANRLLALGLLQGVGLSILLFATSPLVAVFFGLEPDVESSLAGIYIFVIVLQPLTALCLCLGWDWRWSLIIQIHGVVDGGRWSLHRRDFVPHRRHAIRDLDGSCRPHQRSAGHICWLAPPGAGFPPYELSPLRLRKSENQQDRNDESKPEE